jgi:hypothetical protein
MTIHYQSEIELGAKYRDTQTGYEGIAVFIEFHQWRCEQVALEKLEGGEVKAFMFDADRLAQIAPPVKPYEPVRTGGYRNPVRRTG